MAVVTFTTDFGTSDGYAGAMKGAVLALAPDAVLVDISHQIPRHDVTAGAWTLACAAACFPAGTIHVAVVDPGVGGGRAEIVVEGGGHRFVGPDNGLLSLAARPPRKAFRIEDARFRREPVSPTFHGRDVFAVAAGRLAQGHAVQEVGAPMPGVVAIAGADGGPLDPDCSGQVFHVDGFGNLVTSFVGGTPEGRWCLTCAGRDFSLLGGRTFSDVERGAMVLYVGSSGRVEIAVREGSAATRTGAGAGTSIRLRRDS